MLTTISPKKFLIIFTSLLSTFLLYHLIIWNFSTKQIFNREDTMYIGDLGRLSYQLDSLVPRQLEYTMTDRFLTSFENKKIGILTVGDSFSNAGAGGKNPYYQDYLANRFNKNILNIKYQDKKNDPFKSILHLYNTGWLEKHKPDAIIIEFVQRLSVSKFSKDFDFNYIGKEKEPIIEQKIRKNSHIPMLTSINLANYKIPFYMLKHKLDNNNQINNIYKFQLNKKVFSTSKYESSLLILDADIKSIESNNINSITKLNNNFNKLALMLKKLNIKLFFMPAVDKYDLYYKYLTDTKLPKNNFFNIIRPLEKEYYFVDTKEILTTLIESGVKDVFYSDDTHWSYKASEAISKDKIFTNNL